MPEKVQLCTIGLLLSDNGYERSEGQLYFAETQTRVTIPFDDELVAHTLRLVDKLRAAGGRLGCAATARGQPQVSLGAPLSASACRTRPTSMLAAAPPLPGASHPATRAARPLYVTEQGARVGVRSGRVVVSKNRESSNNSASSTCRRSRCTATYKSAAR